MPIALGSWSKLLKRRGAAAARDHGPQGAPATSAHVDQLPAARTGGRSTWRWLLTGGSALAVAAVLALAAATRSTHSESGMALYLRHNADQLACKAAAPAISVVTAGASITFVDNCNTPIVTESTNEPGYVIVTRVVEMPATDKDVHRTYSVLMDGRGLHQWRPVGVKQAPQHPTLDLSLLRSNS